MTTMETRDQLLRQLRPEITLPAVPTSEVEAFQHQVLRPILKFQHVTLVRIFEAHLEEVRIKMRGKGAEERLRIISAELKGHPGLRARLLGLVLGMLTGDELEFFFQNRSELTRRVITLLIQRFSDAWST
ncbi:MAG: hypothetical protein SF053_02715 [Bacteroidia bacterium]|nr:hypothetical protein [Bacteroidia bacterium]